MKLGDPFETEALDATRARQRRELRLLPAWVVERVARGMRSADVNDPFERGPLEELLRALAEPEREAARTTLDGLKQAAWSVRAANFIARRNAIEAQWDTLTERLAGDVAGTKSDDGPIPVEHVGNIYRYIRLLVLADELADDGYRDPRLR